MMQIQGNSWFGQMKKIIYYMGSEIHQDPLQLSGKSIRAGAQNLFDALGCSYSSTVNKMHSIAFPLYYCSILCYFPG